MSPNRHRHHRTGTKSIWDMLIKDNTFAKIWDGFWSPPDIVCPKCGCAKVEFYDPFFFAPLRTLNGRRRYICKECKFVWRKSRSSQSFFGKIGME